MIRDRTRRMHRLLHAFLPTCIVILWIDVFVWLMHGKRYAAFLQPKLFPLLILAVSILVVFLIPFVLKGQAESHGPSKKEMWARTAVLCLPILFLYASYGQSLGVDALTKRMIDGGPGFKTAAGTEKNPLRNPGSDRTMTLLDLVRDLKTYHGREIITSGSVYRDSSIPDGYFMLFQFVITCCAADAQPVWVLVKTSQSSTLENESWVEAEGRLVFEQYQENRIPVIEAGRVRRLPTPPVEKRYLYF